MFSGGVITNKKLQKGTLVQLTTSSSKSSDKSKIFLKIFLFTLKPIKKALETEMKTLRETIYLFKFLFPDNSFPKSEKLLPKFNEPTKTQNIKLLSSLFKNQNSKSNYESLFINISKNSDRLPETEEQFINGINYNPIDFPLRESQKEDDQDLTRLLKKPKIPNLPIGSNNQAEEPPINRASPLPIQKMKIPQLKLTMTENNNENLENGHYEEENNEMATNEEHIDVELPKRSYRKDKESSFDDRLSENSMKRAQIKNLELSNFLYNI